jgi:RNA polymerase sigma-70 factor (ECF subfamily)
VSPPAAPGPPEFRALFDEHFDYVWNSLRHLGVRAGDVEDLTQEVFVRIHARLGDYDPARPLRPWIFAFAYRVASDYRRLTRQRLEVVGVRSEPAARTRDAEEQLALREDRALALAALDAVELDRRAVFVLHVLDERPIPEVAEALGIPTNTAYSRLRLAREDFAAAAKRLRAARGDR